jgi:hypothetical protein
MLNNMQHLMLLLSGFCTSAQIQCQQPSRLCLGASAGLKNSSLAAVLLLQNMFEDHLAHQVRCCAALHCLISHGTSSQQRALTLGNAFVV